MDSGGRCVTMPGAWLMLTWSVDSWAVAGSCQHHKTHALDRAEGPSGWMMSCAQAANQSSASAATEGLDLTTVLTVRTLVLSVKVNTLCTAKGNDVSLCVISRIFSLQ